MNKKGKIFLIVGSSGSGKSTILKEILKYFNNLISPIFYTTREIRNNEIEGNEYYFIDEKTFLDYVRLKKILYSYKCHGYNYGIPNNIIDYINNDFNIIFGISRNLIKDFKNDFKNVHIIYIDVEIEEIKKRIYKRKRDNNQNEITYRIYNAEDKKKWIKENKVDFILNNNLSLDEAIINLKKYIGNIINATNF